MKNKYMMYFAIKREAYFFSVLTKIKKQKMVYIHVYNTDPINFFSNILLRMC